MTIRYDTRFIWLYRIAPCVGFGLFVVVTAFAAPPEITKASWGFAALGLPAFALGLYYIQEQARGLPRLEISEGGLDDRGLGVGFIPWHDINYILSWKMKNSGEGVRLVMDAVVRSSYLQECSKLRRIANRMSAFLTGTRGLAVNTHGYDVSRDEIVAFMRDYHARAIDPGEPND